METAAGSQQGRADVRLMNCRPLVVGFHPCSFMGFRPDMPSLQGTPLAVVGVAVYNLSLIVEYHIYPLTIVAAVQLKISIETTYMVICGHPLYSVTCIQ